MFFSGRKLASVPTIRRSRGIPRADTRCASGCLAKWSALTPFGMCKIRFVGYAPHIFSELMKGSRRNNDPVATGEGKTAEPRLAEPTGVQLPRAQSHQQYEYKLY